MLIKDYVAISIIHLSAVFVFNLLLLDQNLCCLAMWTTAKSINMTKNVLHGDNFREGIFISKCGIIIEKSLRKAFRLFFSWNLGVLMVINLHCCMCDIICWYMIKTNIFNYFFSAFYICIHRSWQKLPMVYICMLICMYRLAWEYIYWKNGVFCILM